MFRNLRHSAFANLLGLVACLFAAPAFGQSSDARDALDRIELAQESELAAFERALRDYEDLTARIEALKQSTRVFWDAAELDELLRQQEAAAESLMAQDRAIQTLRSQREAQAAEVADELRGQVRELEGRIATASPLDRSRIASDMNELTREIGQLGAPLPEYSPVPLEAITSATEGSPDELYAASDELTDQEARLERELEDVRVRLADARASARVLRSESEFSFIEALLEDDGSRRLGSRGTSSDRAGATALQEDSGTTGAATNDDFADTVESTSRGEEAAEAPVPSEDPGAGAPEAESPAEPGFGDADNDGALAGGGAQGPAEFGAAPLEPGPSEASLVQVDGPTAGPDRIDDPRRRRTGRTGSPVDVLSEREAALLRELESVRTERERLIDRARELDGL